jgi:hypothetical protein
MKRAARHIVYGGGHPNAPSVKTIGTVQDLYFWIADDEIDTILPLQNYFSVFFPNHDTATTVHIEFYGPNGGLLGSTTVALPHLATPMLRVSELLARCAPDPAAAQPTYGNLLWHIAIPMRVVEAVGAAMSPFLFWDRLYIGYVARKGGACFMHGVDKYDVRPIEGKTVPWIKGASPGFTAQPEIPIDIAAYAELEVIVQNRASEARDFRLDVVDHRGQLVGWNARVAPRGVHRYIFSETDTQGLATERPLALSVSGLPTRYGRPILLKKFNTGALSIMHC